MYVNKNNRVTKSISAIVLYPLFALNSILFYLFGFCGHALYFYLSLHVLYPGSNMLHIPSMELFTRGSVAILVYMSIVCAIAFSRRIEKSKLIIGFFISFFVYVLAPFVYRTSDGSLIDLGIAFDVGLLCIAFWLQPGLFFIISFIKRIICKNKPVPAASKKSAIINLLVLFIPVFVAILIAGSVLLSNRASCNELEVVAVEYAEVFGKESVITVKKGDKYNLSAIDKTNFNYYFESNA